MRLKHQSIIIFVLLLLAMAMAQFMLTRALMMPKFIEIEEKDFQANVQRVEQMFNQEIGHLDTICHDWASWNDAVEFMESDGRAFIARNLSGVSFFRDININHLQFIDTKGKTRWVNSELSDGTKFSLDHIQKENISLDDKLLPVQKSNENDYSYVNGYIVEQNQVMLTCVRHILTSDDEGPSKGYVIFGRFLDVDALKNVTRVNLSIVKVDAKVLAGFKNNASMPLVVVMENDFELQSILYIRDIYGHYPIGIKLEYAKSITREGGATINLTALLTVLTGLSAIMLIIYLISRNILTPLSRINRHVLSVVENHDYKSRLDWHEENEFGVLARSFNELLATIEQKTRQLEAANHEFKQLSLRDSLTGLANRRKFDQALINEWNHYVRLKTNISIIMCDIDFFKKYNDTYGHQMGDECIIKVAEILTESVNRSIDVVARYGGEEFVILLNGTNIDGAVFVARKIMIALERANIIHEKSDKYKRVTMSLGVASTTNTILKSSDELLKHADDALYVSKENGRNQISVFDENGIQRII